MKVVQGDLIELASQGAFDVIVHGCNCQCAMDAGIAKAIRTKFPEAYAADCATPKGDRAKLGTISTATVKVSGGRLAIVNAYTQFHWHGKQPLADYDAIERAFRAIREGYSGQRIGYPRIGAGLAGGDWTKIEAIIAAQLEGEDHTLVEFKV